jgi:chromatin remodeling complex protein RSC6
MSDNNNLKICNCNICFEDQTCINGFFKKLHNNQPISKENCERSCVCKVDVCVNCVKKLNKKCPTCRTTFEAWGDLLTTQTNADYNRPEQISRIPRRDEEYWLRPALDINRVGNFKNSTKISDELADFLGKPSGTQMSPVEAVRGVMTYINIKKLLDKNKKNINPDANLAALLNLNETDELTIFNFQRYLSNHYIRT